VWKYVLAYCIVAPPPPPPPVEMPPEKSDAVVAAAPAVERGFVVVGAWVVYDAPPWKPARA
jgi:hypothetical protein